MKTIRMAALVVAFGVVAKVQAQLDIGTAFTYQGTLENGSGPVTDTCDFRFGLWDDPAAGAQVGGSPVTVAAMDVVSGSFTTSLDFGAGAINGTARWLEIEVQCPDDGGFVLLSPRVKLTPAPLALALPGLRTEETSTTPNIIGGAHNNLVVPGLIGVTISGGGDGTIGFANIPTCVGGPQDGQECGDCYVDGSFLVETCNDIACIIANGTCTLDPDDCGSGSCAPNFANVVRNSFGTIGGGSNNEVSGNGGTIGGGGSNKAGRYSVVPGGVANIAGGDYSFAAGFMASVRTPASSGDYDGDEGTFIWSDTTNNSFVSTGPDQFLIRATGGVGINTNDPDVDLEIAGGTELSLADGTGYLMVGDQDQVNLAFDTDEIQARNNGAAANLLLNPAGGSVGIGIAPTDPLTVAGIIRSTTGGFELPDGTILDAASDLGIGDITAVTAGTGLTGGGTSGAVTLTVNYAGNGAANTSARSDHYHSSLDASDGSPSAALSVDATGRVGIGVSAPSWELEVDGSIAATNPAGSPDGSRVRLTSPSSDPGITIDRGDGLGTVTQTWAIKIENGGDLEINDATANLDRFVIEAGTGEVGIGTVSPSAMLHVVGDIVYTGTITDISDRRLKENIAPLEGALAKLERLRGVYFNMSDTPDRRDVGLIAQDVQAVLPEAVRVIDPENGYLGVAYPSVIPLLVEGIKEQDDAIAEENCKIELLTSEVANLKSEIDELRLLVKALADRNDMGDQR